MRHVAEFSSSPYVLKTLEMFFNFKNFRKSKELDKKRIDDRVVYMRKKWVKQPTK